MTKKYPSRTRKRVQQTRFYSISDFIQGLIQQTRFYSVIQSPTKPTVEYSLMDFLKSVPQEPNEKIATFFFMRTPPFNAAALSFFVLKIDESIEFPKQNTLQSYRVPHRNKFPRSCEGL